MRPRPRALALLLAALLVAVVGAASPVAATTMPTGGTAPASPAVAAAPKVVIIVGPTEGATGSYKASGDAAASVALQYTPNVVKIYSPTATPAAVQAAVAGASIVIYLGHGNGWPSPYPNDPAYTTKDGFGLNDPANQSDYVHKYYGEPYVAGLTFAPNAVVLLNHLCYASGNSEPQLEVGPDDVNLDPSIARQRIDNYGAAFLKAGAKAVIAEGHGSIGPMISALFTTHQSVYDAWRTMPDANGNLSTFASTRTPGATAAMDPNQPSAGYWRSFVGSTTVQTDDVISASAAADQVRLAGPDRYATAAAISAANFAPGVAVAFIATGLNFPDALAGAAVAGKLGAPVLLVDTDTIPSTTAAELTRLAPAQIVVLGGPSVVSDAVLGALVPYATSGSVVRISGPDRFATAAAISAAYFSPGVDIAFVATGLNFPDALAGAAVAGHMGAPILLVNPTDIPAPTQAELTRLAPKRIVILGSTGVVGTAVAAQLATLTTGAVDRIAGPDRYATAAAISAAFFPADAALALVATGLNFPDALAGAAVAGLKGAPILLVDTYSLPAATATEAARLAPKDVMILGSSGVVSNSVAWQIGWFQP